MQDTSPIHVPVMAAEVLEWLQPRPGQLIVDGTLGGGGHTRLLAECVAPQGFVVSLDRDPQALAAAERNLAGTCVKLVAASFRELSEVLDQLEIPAIDGLVLDLGLSSDQLADAQRGFSFDSPGPLDLRFDPTEGQPAWQMIERMDVTELANLIYQFGEERHSRRIARNIVEFRAQESLRTAAQLATIVRRSVPRGRPADRIDPATRTFQALRIAVNDELGALTDVLKQLGTRLKVDGRAAVISFHSLEDRIVKEAFRDDPHLEPLTRKPLRPTEDEIQRNPRAQRQVARGATNHMTGNETRIALSQAR